MDFDFSDAVVAVAAVVVAAAVVVVDVAFVVVEAFDDALAVASLRVVADAVVMAFAVDVLLVAGGSRLAVDCVALGVRVVVGGFWGLELLPAVALVLVATVVVVVLMDLGEILATFFLFFSTLSQGQALVLWRESITPGSACTTSSDSGVVEELELELFEPGAAVVVAVFVPLEDRDRDRDRSEFAADSGSSELGWDFFARLCLAPLFGPGLLFSSLVVSTSEDGGRVDVVSGLASPPRRLSLLLPSSSLPASPPFPFTGSAPPSFLARDSSLPASPPFGSCSATLARGSSARR